MYIGLAKYWFMIGKSKLMDFEFSAPNRDRVKPRKRKKKKNKVINGVIVKTFCVVYK